MEEKSKVVSFRSAKTEKQSKELEAKFRSEFDEILSQIFAEENVFLSNSSNVTPEEPNETSEKNTLTSEDIEKIVAEVISETGQLLGETVAHCSQTNEKQKPKEKQCDEEMEEQDEDIEFYDYYGAHPFKKSASHSGDSKKSTSHSGNYDKLASHSVKKEKKVEKKIQTQTETKTKRSFLEKIAEKTALKLKENFNF